MDSPVDLLNDSLAEAPLTPEQRRVWDLTRAELIIARSRLEEMEVRIKVLEKHAPEDVIVHTVLTRPEFNREVARMLAFDERYGGLSSVLYFDIENLTDIIARDGREAANTIVRCVCDTFTKYVRSSDIIGRLAVDEFGVLLARCDNAATWKKGENLAALLYQELSKLPNTLPKTIISYGAYTFNENEDVATGLKNAAESVTKASDKN
jgi:diguanylate cyclase (GGDEF)-like protein